MSPRKSAALAEAPHDRAPTDKSNIDHIQDALRGLRFGQVTIIVQDGVVVQIDRTERRRIGKT